jgi:putative transposase
MWNLDPPPGFRGLDLHGPMRFYYRHLPHWRQEGATYFVTFRLADALPQERLRELQSLRQHWEATHPPPRAPEDWDSYARQVTVKAERWMDEGYGCCYFRETQPARWLSDALLHFQEERYFVSCFTVMPNHCHLVIRPFVGHELERILKVCKGYVAWQINRLHRARGAMWEQESYDRIIRDEEHLYRIVQYIGRNPAKARIPRDRWVRWIHRSWQQAGWGFVDDAR